MTDTLYDALEVCLQALEQGSDLEACLALFPGLADELRPILETAAQARAQAVQDVPVAALRRGRARLLQHAAEMRERDQAPARVPFWRRPGRQGRLVRLTATFLATVAFLLSGGTGLVFASSNSLPGDNLYTVKRGWEDVQLVLTIDPKAKSQRESEFEQERIQEIHALFSESRQTQVNFVGVVETQAPAVWQIAGLQISIDAEVALTGQIVPGSQVQVIGETENGSIKAEQILLVAAAPATPTSVPTRLPRPSETVRANSRDGGEQTDGGSASDGSMIESAQPETSAGEHDTGETPAPGEHSGSNSSSGSGSGSGSSSGSGGGSDGGGDH